jgi:hypothetical protein
MKKRFDPFKFVAEIMGLASVLMIACGINRIYPPAAWIFLGIVCGVPCIVSTLKSLLRRRDGQ